MSKPFFKIMWTFLWAMRHSYLCAVCFFHKASRSYICWHGKSCGKTKVSFTERLQELNNSLIPSYKEIKCNILFQKGRLIENSKIVTSDINKHGEDLHQQIDEIIKKLSSDLDEMDRRHLVFLNNREDEIKQMISEITWTIVHLEEIINSDDVVLVSA